MRLTHNCLKRSGPLSMALCSRGVSLDLPAQNGVYLELADDCRNGLPS